MRIRTRNNTGLKISRKRQRELGRDPFRDSILGKTQLTERERKYAVSVGNLDATLGDLKRIAKAKAKAERKAAKRSRLAAPDTLTLAATRTVAFPEPTALYDHNVHQLVRR